MRYVAIEQDLSSAGDAIMDEARTYVNVRLVGHGERFQPTWVLVAQWDGVHPYPHGSDDHEGIDEEYLSRVSLFHVKV